MTDPSSDQREIEASLEQALTRAGLTGRVLCAGNIVEFHASGAPPLSIDASFLIQQWGLLPQEMRARKVSELVERIMASSRPAPPAFLPERVLPGALAEPSRTRNLAVGAVLALVVFIVAWRVVSWVRQPRADVPAPAASASGEALPETADDVTARRARMCDAARRRVYGGSSVGPLDTEGWVAELWMAKRGAGSVDAELRAATQAGKLSPASDAMLAALDGGTAEVVPGASGTELAGWSGATVRFGGRYSAAYLDPELRPRFVALASRLAVKSGAEVAALYARCAHLSYHDMGAWFRGVDAPSAAASVIFAIGAFAERPAVRLGDSSTRRGTSDLDAIVAASKSMDSTRLLRLLGDQGGNLSTEASSGSVTVGFPFLGGTRALSASRALARDVGIGSD